MGKGFGIKKQPFTIVIDTREKKPYKFSGAIRKGLKSGDYSILGYESRIAIERKSKSDMYGTISPINGKRARFKRELERMDSYDYAALVIECSESEFMTPPEYSRLHPNAAIGSLKSWDKTYSINVIFCDGRVAARHKTLELLNAFYINIVLPGLNDIDMGGVTIQDAVDNFRQDDND